MKFQNRKEAGRKLSKLIVIEKKGDAVILALARGGIPIAHEISRNTDIPFAPIIVRKIGAPFNKEFGVGAITENSLRVIDHNALKKYGIPEESLSDIVSQEEEELKRRVMIYRKNNKLPNLKDKIVILVDDGMATGITMKAAIARVKQDFPRKIMVMVPVCARDTKKDIEKEVDQLISIYYPRKFDSVGQWYKEFSQVSDDEVISLVNR